MHRRRLPAGVPLPARAGVAWSGFPSTCRALGFCAAGSAGPSERDVDHYRSAPPAFRSSLVRASPLGLGASGVGGSSDRRTGSQPRAAARASRRRSWGLPIAPFAGLIPPAGAGDVSPGGRVCWRARRAIPSAAGPRAVGLCLRPEWFSPGDRPTGFGKNVRANGTIPSGPRERSARSGEARPGFWASLPCAIRARRRSSFSADTILPWASRPLSGLRSGAT
jgi:hypothetical protein